LDWHALRPGLTPLRGSCHQDGRCRPPAPPAMVPVRAAWQCRAAGCSSAARRPAWRRRRTARSPGRSGSAAAGSPPATRSCAPPSSGGDPAGLMTPPTAGDPHLDPPPRQVVAAAAVVVGLVRVALVGPAAPPTAGGADLGDVVQQRLEHAGVRGVGRGHQQRQPAALSGQVQLAAALGPVDRVGASVVPRTARRLKESTLTRDHSSWPGSPSSSSRPRGVVRTPRRGPTRQTAASRSSRCRSRTRPPAAAPTGSRCAP
jgi:hypothetical protein